MSLRSEERDEVDDDDPFAKENPADFPTLGPEDDAAAEERPKSVFPDSLRALLTPLAAIVPTPPKSSVTDIRHWL